MENVKSVSKNSAFLNENRQNFFAKKISPQAAQLNGVPSISLAPRLALSLL